MTKINAILSTVVVISDQFLHARTHHGCRDVPLTTIPPLRSSPRSRRGNCSSSSLAEVVVAVMVAQVAAVARSRGATTMFQCEGRHRRRPRQLSGERGRERQGAAGRVCLRACSSVSTFKLRCSSHIAMTHADTVFCTPCSLASKASCMYLMDSRMAMRYPAIIVCPSTKA